MAGLKCIASCHCSDHENRLSISACKCKQSSGEFISLSRVECHQYRALFYIEQIPVYHLQNTKTKGEQAQFLNWGTPEDTGKLQLEIPSRTTL